MANFAFVKGYPPRKSNYFPAIPNHGRNDLPLQ